MQLLNAILQLGKTFNWVKQFWSTGRVEALNHHFTLVSKARFVSSSSVEILSSFNILKSLLRINSPLLCSGPNKLICIRIRTHTCRIVPLWIHRQPCQHWVTLAARSNASSRIARCQDINPDNHELLINAIMSRTSSTLAACLPPTCPKRPSLTCCVHSHTTRSNIRTPLTVTFSLIGR